MLPFLAMRCPFGHEAQFCALFPHSRSIIHALCTSERSLYARTENAAVLLESKRERETSRISLWNTSLVILIVDNLRIYHAPKGKQSQGVLDSIALDRFSIKSERLM
jgi:hypothetical protein